MASFLSSILGSSSSKGNDNATENANNLPTQNVAVSNVAPPQQQVQQQVQQMQYTPQRNRRSPFAFGQGGKPKTEQDLLKPKTDKPKDDKRSVVAMLVDRSGSMSSMGKEVSTGCNTYLDEQRKTDSEDGMSTHVIFSVFDNSYNQVRSTPLQQMSPVTDKEVAPRGSTALFDSIGQLIADTIAILEGEPDAVPGNVGVFILTDGLENASSRWTKELIKKQIKLLEGDPYNWEFYFAAANQDAMSTGASFGVKTSQCMSYGYDADHMQEAFKASSAAMSRQKKKLSSSFTPSERAMCK